MLQQPSPLPEEVADKFRSISVVMWFRSVSVGLDRERLLHQHRHQAVYMMHPIEKYKHGGLEATIDGKG